MSIEQNADGFHEWRDYDKSAPGLGIESARIDECLAYFHNQKFGGLFGNPYFGFNETDLDFLRHVADATWLWFWDVDLKDVEALYELQKIEHFGIHPKRPGIDFSRFPALRTVVNHWIKADTGITDSTMTEYTLWHYKPRSKSFNDLEIPANVKRLELYWANPASLAGLPVMKKLKSLEIHRCRNLQDLSELPRIAPNLRDLTTTTSSKLDVSSGVVDHPKLKSARIDGTVVVGEST